MHKVSYRMFCQIRPGGAGTGFRGRPQTYWIRRHVHTHAAMCFKLHRFVLLYKHCKWFRLDTAFHVELLNIECREWAPSAIGASLIGDFNNWSGNEMEKDAFGVWTLSLPDLPDGSPAIPHNSRVKVREKLLYYS